MIVPLSSELSGASHCCRSFAAWTTPPSLSWSLNRIVCQPGGARLLSSRGNLQHSLCSVGQKLHYGTLESEKFTRRGSEQSG